MTEKQFVKKFFLVFLGLLVAVIGFIVICDPYFHYHAPMGNFRYVLSDQRYQNDGISKHFEYDAIITGTSMAENFKPSEFDELFGVNSIQTAFQGASYKEINDYLTRAISYNPEIKAIIRCLDTNAISQDKDYLTYEDYPDYLYDNNVFNDVSYVLNKTIILNKNLKHCLIPTLKRAETTTFDEYSNWNADYTFGKERVMESYIRPEKKDGENITLTEETKQIIYDNITQNVIDLAKANPQIEFYYFYTPYSILYFDGLNQENTLEERFEMLEYATSLILEIDNIKLYSFFDEYDIITDFNNYKDSLHYGESINTYMLKQMSENQSLLTAENYQNHFRECYEFYASYPYEEIF